MTAHELATALGSDGKLTGRDYRVTCPAHDDKTPSLDIREGDNGRTLVYCRSGCSNDAVIQVLETQGLWGKKGAANMTNGTGPAKPRKTTKATKKKQTAPPPWKRPVEATYPFETDTGELKYENLRFSDGLEPRFMIRHPHPDKKTGHKWGRGDVPAMLFNLPELSKTPAGVCIVEGEKDVLNLADLGFTATTSGSADSWSSKFTPWFKDKDVCIFYDNDEPGKKAAQNIAQSLFGIAKTIRIIDLPNPKKKGDISDWIGKGGERKELLAMMMAAKPYELPTVIPLIVHDEEQDDTDTYEPDTYEPDTHEPDTHEPDTQLTLKQNVAALEHTWPKMDANLRKPLSTPANLQHLLKTYNIKVRFNLMNKDVEISVPNQKWTVENYQKSSFAHIIGLAMHHELPKGEIDMYLGLIADNFPYNPAADWVDSRPWDGNDRIEQLADSLGSDDIVAALRILRKWLLGAIAALYEPKGLKSKVVMVLQGGQHGGKTSWFWSLLGGKEEWGLEGHILKPGDRDSEKTALSVWLTELGEIDQTFKKSDMSALKAFIGKQQDNIWLRYSRHVSLFPRRTQFMGTVNDPIFLHDKTGSARWAVIAVGKKINARHKINMQQLWAQVKTLYRAGENWNWERHEIEWLERNNDRFKSVSPFFELISKKYDMESMYGKVAKTASEVCIELGYKAPKDYDTRQCSAALREIFGEPKRTGKGMTWYLPDIR